MRSSVTAEGLRGLVGGLDGVRLGLVEAFCSAEGEAPGVVWLDEEDSSRMAESV